ASLDREAPVICELEAVLSSEEKVRADQFHFAKDRNRYVIARGLLRELLGAYLQQPPKSLEFSYAQHGKPLLSGANSTSGLNFNLSHSGDMVAYAIARERNLGIDVEQMRPDLAGDDIAERYFSAREVSDLRTLPPEKKVEGFFNCWTRKEAYLKATGMGLHIALDSFAVNLLPEEPAEFLIGVDGNWHLAAHRPAESYVAAVVYDGAPCAIQYFSADNMARQETKIG
ncbi:MAG TPA: 4'-phosphopantetheinyl transferase superfamily protein, partial [Candidatus Saccharimonadales bacterium]|nr:4'-phosphopantetheinyl transferase superfamily protein [Candidatus Saccharimonadales bacterium]